MISNRLQLLIDINGATAVSEFDRIRRAVSFMDWLRVNDPGDID